MPSSPGGPGHKARDPRNDRTNHAPNTSSDLSSQPLDARGIADGYVHYLGLRPRPRED